MNVEAHEGRGAPLEGQAVQGGHDESASMERPTTMAGDSRVNSPTLFNNLRMLRVPNTLGREWEVLVAGCIQSRPSRERDPQGARVHVDATAEGVRFIKAARLSWS